jgi:lambda family phage portal protein
MRPTQNWLDRAVGTVSPRLGLRRLRARIATDIALRHYESAASGRRTGGWHRTSSDANVANGVSLGRLRDLARDLTRNNGQMGEALRTIANHTVGWGIVAKPARPNPRALALWKAWAESTACDADGRDDIYGLEKLVMRGVAESGEMLVRRRIRRLDDGLPIPLQLQVLEPDFLDTAKTMNLPNGGHIVQGVEFDVLGRRAAYWLFGSHPGSSLSTGASVLLGNSRRVPASEILHVYQRDRAGQVRAVSWFAPVILPAKDLDEYGDAQLMKQKIAACLAVIQTDVNGDAPALGSADDAQTPPIDELQPGGIINATPGRDIKIVEPPTVGDYGPFMTVEQRKIAKGLGLSYEDFSGDYSQVNFSSARMARLAHYDNVYDWRWRLLIPQFCNPVWGWAMEAAQMAGALDAAPGANWSAPPMPFIEPDKEGLAIQRNVRNGIQSWSDAVRERGYDPQELLDEMGRDIAEFDRRGIVLDIDPRNMTQAGQLQGSKAAKKVPPAATSA